jgi:hypothetical protein
MAIHLYKKTHRKTGLNYLGKTTQDPLKYKGSGTIWVRHIKKHGNDVDTIILKECSTNEEVKTWGLYYSNLWNVVDSKEWANIKPEAGEGGSIKGRKLPSMKGKVAHNKGATYPFIPRRKWSEDRKASSNGSNGKLKNRIRPRLSCLCCKKVVDEANFKRYHQSC